MPVLTTRVKWCHPVSPVEIGTVVLVLDPTFTRNNWPKGIVSKIYPGKNGQVRVVNVRTNSGIIKRPVCKICVLDVKSLGYGCGDPAPGGNI